MLGWVSGGSSEAGLVRQRWCAAMALRRAVAWGKRKGLDRDLKRKGEGVEVELGQWLGGHGLGWRQLAAGGARRGVFGRSGGEGGSAARQGSDASEQRVSACVLECLARVRLKAQAGIHWINAAAVLGPAGRSGSSGGQ